MERRRDVAGIALAFMAMLVGFIALGFHTFTQDNSPAPLLVLISGVALLTGSFFLLFGSRLRLFGLPHRYFRILSSASIAVVVMSLLVAFVFVFYFPGQVWSIALMTLVNAQGALALHYASRFISKNSSNEGPLIVSQDS